MAKTKDLVAVVGGDSLLAREIRDLLSDSTPAPRVQLISAAPEGAALLAANDKEAVVMTPLSAEIWKARASLFSPDRPPPADAP